MILFTILTIALILLIVIGVIALGVFGAGFIIVFGDVIICAVLIVWILKKIFFNKRK